MKIAPSFSKIYDETAAAELAGLKELLGAGYRRALEFLVKEYLIFINPDKAAHYKTTALRNCISEHIHDATVKELANKAASVGNDFTHFETYGNHDIDDLMGLIELVRRWIELNDETELIRARLLQPQRRKLEGVVYRRTWLATSSGGCFDIDAACSNDAARRFVTRGDLKKRTFLYC